MGLKVDQDRNGRLFCNALWTLEPVAMNDYFPAFGDFRAGGANDGKVRNSIRTLPEIGVRWVLGSGHLGLSGNFPIKCRPSVRTSNGSVEPISDE